MSSRPVTPDVAAKAAGRFVDISNGPTPPGQSSSPINTRRPPPLAAYTIEQFCEAHGISVAFYHKLRGQGRGPRLMRLGRRVLISQESAAEWRAKHEAETTNSPVKVTA
jgi:hypothetical protein